MARRTKPLSVLAKQVRFVAMFLASLLQGETIADVWKVVDAYGVVQFTNLAGC